MDLQEDIRMIPPKAISEGGSLPDYDREYYISDELQET